MPIREPLVGGEGRRQSQVSASAVRLVLAILPIGLIAFAAPMTLSGFAVDSSFPVPAYIAMNVDLPRSMYIEAAEKLSRASTFDGDAQLARAEALAISKASPLASQKAILLALQDSPTSCRAWTLLAEQQAKTGDEARAGSALETALELGPFDYWMTARRVADAAQLWRFISPMARSEALREAKLLWQEKDMRDSIPLVLSSDKGRMLWQKAFEDDAQSLRAVNRWLALYRRNG